MRIETPETTLAFTRAGGIIRAYAASTSDAFQGALLAYRLDAPLWLETCLAQIDCLRQLPANWDSYGAPPVDPRSLLVAKSLVEELSRVESVESPTITATAEGNVGLCWDDGQRSLDVEVFADRPIAYSYLNLRNPDEFLDGETDDVNDLAVLLTHF